MPDLLQHKWIIAVIIVFAFIAVLLSILLFGKPHLETYTNAWYV